MYETKNETEEILPENWNQDTNCNYTEHVDLLKKHCRFGYQLLVCVIATSITFGNGLVTGHTAGMIRKIKVNETLPFACTEADLITITNAASGGMILGPVIFTYFINHFGRRKTVFLMFLPVILYFVTIYFIQSRLYYMFAVFFGTSGKLMASSVVSIYASEISAPHLRGVFVVLIPILFYPGYLIGIVASWWLPLPINSASFAVLTLVISLLLFHLPESPYYLIRNNEILSAKIVLNRLYSNETVSNKEYFRLSHHINKSLENPESFSKIYKQKKYWQPILLLNNLFLLLTFSGSMFFIYYSPVWLSDGKYRYLSPFTCQIVLTIMPLPFSLFKTVIFRFMKRKSIGIMTFSLNAVALLCMSGFYYLKDTKNSLLDGQYDLFPFVFLILFRISLDIGVGSLPYVYFRELIQVEVLAYSSFIVDMLVPVGKAFGMFVFNSLKSHFSYSASFLFCFVWVVVGTGLFLRFTPETKDKFIENVQEEMEDKFDLRVPNKTRLIVDNLQ